MTLANENRIKGKRRIEEVKANGKLFQSDNFGVRVLKQETEGLPRFAFIISKKISKLAVHRNRINRALNEAIRRNISYIPPSFDYVFLAKKSIGQRTTEEITNEVWKLVPNLKL